jgi:hypothetical protein
MLYQQPTGWDNSRTTPNCDIFFVSERGCKQNLEQYGFALLGYQPLGFEFGSCHVVLLKPLALFESAEDLVGEPVATNTLRRRTFPKSVASMVLCFVDAHINDDAETASGKVSSAQQNLPHSVDVLLNACSSFIGRSAFLTRLHPPMYLGI